MRLTAPKQMIFFVALALGIIGLLAGFGILAAAADQAFYLMTAAWALLTVSVYFKGI